MFIGPVFTREAITAPRRPVFFVARVMLVAALLAVYWLLLDARTTELFLVYYTATSLLHFWYDGLIWKVSKPAVSRPLGIEPGK